MHKVTLTIGLVVAALVAATPARAASIPIGSFYFGNFGLGPVITLENNSDFVGIPDDFNEITIKLELAGGGSETYGFGTLDPGVLNPSFFLTSETGFNFAPLSSALNSNIASLDVLDPSLYTRALLSLTFGPALLVDNTPPICITGPCFDNSVPPVEVFDSAEIGIEDDLMNPVPEPSTIILLIGGVIVLFVSQLAINRL